MMSETRSAFPVPASSATAGQPTNLTSSGGAVNSSGTVASLAGAVDDAGPHLTRRRSSSVGVHPEDAYPPPMTITGSINEDGLGAVSWWDVSEGEVEGEGGEETAPKETKVES